MPSSIFYLIAPLVLIIVSAWPAHADGPDLSRYELTFSDEFNGNTLDPEKWNTAFLWGPYFPINNEEQLYVDTLGMHQGFDHSPFQFTGTSLKIIATPVSAQLQPPERPAENDPVWSRFSEYRFNGATDTSPGYQPSDVKYLSGLLTSYDAFRYTHGYVEARMRLPAGQGLWPAFWTNTSFYVEDVPEIDIMEFLGHQTDRVYHTYHHFDTKNNWQKISTPSYTTIGPDFTLDWHTYGMEWGPTEIIWYVDGEETRRIDRTQFDIPNQAIYLLANLAVGGNWPGSPDDTTVFPAELEIDYIRAYRHKPVDTITPEVLATDFQLMFEDDFNGNAIDAGKWKSSYLWGPYFPINNEQQIYPDMLGEHQDYPINPLSVSDGKLTITARAVPEAELPDAQAPDSEQFVRNPTWQADSGYRAPGNANYHVPDYVSGLLTTYDSFKFVNGYAEMRAKLPAGSGLWPAFWLLNGYYVDQQPEIDIMEFRGERPFEIVHSYHHFTSQGLQSESSVTAGDDFSTAFHTFGVHWQPGRIDWYVDGEITYSTSGEQVSSQLMYLILNLAVGGNFVDAVDENSLPASFQIDYVRVWQRSLPAQVPPSPTNQAPVAQDDTAGPLDIGGSITVDVLANDTDEDGNVDPATLTLVDLPNLGTATIEPDGRVTYVHDGTPGSVQDVLSYTVKDDQGAESNVATVTFSPFTERSIILTPLNGSALQGPSLNLTWEHSGTAPDNWAFWLGTSPGARNLGTLSVPGSRNSLVINDLPVDGSTIYLRFWKKTGSWQLIDDYQYTAYSDPGASLSTAAIVFPANGTTLTSDTQLLEWESNGEPPQQWALWLGSTPGGREHGSVAIDGTEGQHRINALPVDGSTIYLRFWRKDTAWQLIDDYQYTAYSRSQSTPAAPIITSPANESKLSDQTLTLEWQGTGEPPDRWAFWLGTTPGARDIRSFAVDGGENSYTITGLPDNGQAIYLRFWQKQGAWQILSDYKYIASGVRRHPLTGPAIISPANNASLPSRSIELQWDRAGESPESWAFWVGTTIGARNLGSHLVNSAASSLTINDIAGDSSDIYIRFWKKEGSWQTVADYQYSLP